MISKEHTFSRIEQSGNLPTLPAILLKLLAACDNDDTPLSEIAAIISKDPVLSLRILQLVNSAYYGFRYSFKGIEQAVVYLGANTIKNVAVTMSVHQVFGQKRFAKLGSFNIGRFWYHSLLCATLAKRLAQQVGFGNPDEAYLTGLLHNIGRLLLASTFPKEHQTILADTKDRSNILWAEQQLLGVTHAETGSWLVRKWRLGSMMADAIRYHHDPLDRVRETFPLVKIIYLANLLCEDLADEHDRLAADTLLPGLTATDLEEIVAGVAEEVEQVARHLEITVEIPIPADHTSATAEILGSVAGDTVPDREEEAEKALVSRVKGVSKLAGFLEDLVRAEEVEEIITVGEQAVHILFSIEEVLFFLADRDGALLRGYASPQNSLHQTSWGLTLALSQSSSSIARAINEQAMLDLATEATPENLADRQIMTVLGSDRLLLVPLKAQRQVAGVMVLGPPSTGRALDDEERRLLQIIGHQLGLCLQLERIKEQKAADLEAERSAAISMTARKLAHEINNPLGIISNYITSMKLRLTGNDRLLGELAIVDEEIQRISAMISQIDMFAENPVRRLESTDVNGAIEDILQLVRSAQEAGHQTLITFHPDTSLQRITTSKDAIKQVLINLLKNAAEAMDHSGKVTVKTKRVHQDGIDGKTGVRIMVSDSGPGLPERVKANLYTPFITTKQHGHSGLGLSIVHKTVKDLGGNLSCTTSEEEGTSFAIFLPDSAAHETSQWNRQ